MRGDAVVAPILLSHRRQGAVRRRSWTTLLDGAITASALAALGITAFMELTGPRRRRLRVDLSEAALPRIDEFLRGRGDGRRLTLVARPGRGEVALEFLAALSELNVEDEIS